VVPGEVVEGEVVPAAGVVEGVLPVVEELEPLVAGAVPDEELVEPLLPEVELPVVAPEEVLPLELLEEGVELVLVLAGAAGGAV
jgi:hypothetical protein